MQYLEEKKILNRNILSIPNLFYRNLTAPKSTNEACISRYTDLIVLPVNNFKQL